VLSSFTIAIYCVIPLYLEFFPPIMVSNGCFMKLGVPFYGAYLSIISSWGIVPFINV
jgi:hypothetical protein